MTVSQCSGLFSFAGDLILVTLELETGGRMTEHVKGALSLWDMIVYFQDQLKSPGKFTSPSTGRVVLFLQGREVHSSDIHLAFPSVPRLTLSLSLFPPFLLLLLLEQFFSDEHLKMTLLELGLTPERGVTFGIAFRELAQGGVTSQPFQQIQIEPSENELGDWLFFLQSKLPFSSFLFSSICRTAAQAQ